MRQLESWIMLYCLNEATAHGVGIRNINIEIVHPTLMCFTVISTRLADLVRNFSLNEVSVAQK